jgi:hypothetical protein
MPTTSAGRKGRDHPGGWTALRWPERQPIGKQDSRFEIPIPKFQISDFRFEIH